MAGCRCGSPTCHAVRIAAARTRRDVRLFGVVLWGTFFTVVVAPGLAVTVALFVMAARG